MTLFQHFVVVCGAAVLSPFAVCLMIYSYGLWRLNRWVGRLTDQFHKDGHRFGGVLRDIVRQGVATGNVSREMLGSLADACVTVLREQGGIWLAPEKVGDDADAFLWNLRESIKAQESFLTREWLRSTGSELLAASFAEGGRDRWWSAQQAAAEAAEDAGGPPCVRAVCEAVDPPSEPR
jgi:hypothetical protein